MARNPEPKTIVLPAIVIDDARKKLVYALRRARDKQTAGADDWECALLYIFYKYLEAIGIDEDLRRMPMQMWFAKQHEVEQARRRQAGKSGTTMPVGTMMAMAHAAASVTVLKRQGQGNISELLTGCAQGGD